MDAIKKRDSALASRRMHEHLDYVETRVKELAEPDRNRNLNKWARIPTLGPLNAPTCLIKIPSIKNQISNKSQWPKFKIRNGWRCQGQALVLREELVVGRTNATSTNLRNDNNTDRFRIVRRCDTKVVNVLVIGYWNLEFICNLILEIWDFFILHSFQNHLRINILHNLHVLLKVGVGYAAK